MIVLLESVHSQGEPRLMDLFSRAQLAKRRIGRVVRGNNVHVKDEAVSQAHAEVLWDGKQWVITDLGSSNGE